MVGAVLAGGRSQRMGYDKVSLRLQGRPLVEWAVSAVRQVLDEVWIIGGSPGLAEASGARYAPDLVVGVGPLGGVYSALCAIKADLLTVACDMPFIQPALLRGLLSHAPDCDAVVPVNGGYYEPLLAVYRRSCLPALEEALFAGQRRLAGIYGQVNLCTVPEDRWRGWDPEGLSFVNINTPDDLARVHDRLRGDTDWRAPAASSSA